MYLERQVCNSQNHGGPKNFSVVVCALHLQTVRSTEGCLWKLHTYYAQMVLEMRP